VRQNGSRRGNAVAEARKREPARGGKGPPFKILKKALKTVIQSIRGYRRTPNGEETTTCDENRISTPRNSNKKEGKKPQGRRAGRRIDKTTEEEPIDIRSKLNEVRGKSTQRVLINQRAKKRRHGGGSNSQRKYRRRHGKREGTKRGTDGKRSEVDLAGNNAGTLQSNLLNRARTTESKKEEPGKKREENC